MKYSDIINFNPIQTVIQLKDANDETKAKNLVESYVMSDEMAEKFNSGILEELQFDEVIDNKGVLIVGNYGTGKSHLMSLISAIANNDENLNYLGNKKFAGHSQKVAGKFEVLRIEIGSVSNSLRNIIIAELEKDLGKRGVTFKFPKADEITNNKEALIEMMYKFEDKYFAAVLPFLTFLSAEPVMTSKVKSSWAVNIVSGKSYMCIKQDGKFIIDIKGRGKKEINHPENYYYNFNSEESAENSFSEEINSLYKGDVYREITQLESKLNFLSNIVDFSNGEKAEKKKLQFSINYKFENGESKDYKDIFRYNVKENGKKLNLLFFFESEEKFEKNYSKFKRVFADKESVFY